MLSTAHPLHRSLPVTHRRLLPCLFCLRAVSQQFGRFLRREDHRHFETSWNTRPSWSSCARGGCAAFSYSWERPLFEECKMQRKNVRGRKRLCTQKAGTDHNGTEDFAFRHAVP